MHDYSMVHLYLNSCVQSLVFGLQMTKYEIEFVDKSPFHQGQF